MGKRKNKYRRRIADLLIVYIMRTRMNRKKRKKRKK